MITHLYVPDLEAPPDHHGERLCKRCPLPKANRVHDVRERSDEERKVEARLLGEAE